MKRLAAPPALALAVGALLFAFARRILNRPQSVARSVISDPEERTKVDPETGAVTSIQGADLTLPADELEKLWSPRNLERLARTYWAFLTKSTLGIVRVYYELDGRQVCVLVPQLPLLTFQAPEYEMDETRGIVRWRIEKGLLVSRRGRGGSGYLELDITRCESDEPGRAMLHAEVEVANFYPAIASRLGQWLYANTQSRIHVIVTHGFLRSLARLDLAESKVGRFDHDESTPPPEIPRGARSRAARPPRGHLPRRAEPGRGGVAPGRGGRL